MKRNLIRGALRDRWKLAVLAVFAISRLVLVFVETPGSTLAGVNVVYAFEMQRASTLGLPFYEMHEQNRLDADPTAAPLERLVEYPPLALVWMALPTWFLDPVPKYGFVPERQIEAAKVASRAAMFVVDCCGFGLLMLTGATAVRLAFYTASGLALFPFVLDRLDLLLGVIVLAAVILLCRGRPIWAPLAMLAVAINFKATPVVLVPLFLLGTLPADAMDRPARGRLFGLIARRAALLAIFCGVIFAPFFAKDGLATLDFLKYHAARGLQIESVWSTVPIVLAAVLGWPVATTFRYGSMELQSAVTGPLNALASLSTIAVIPALALVLWRLLRGRPGTAERNEGSTLAEANPALFVRCAMVSLLTAMVAAKVLSPQYLLWVLPLGALWEGRRAWMAGAVLVAICVFTTVVYPFASAALLEVAKGWKGYPLWHRVLAAAPLVARNLLLVGLTAWCWRETARAAAAGNTAGVATPRAPAARRTRAR